MDKDFITVAEFAARAGVSRQAIYKRLSTDLQPYVQRLNGILCISKEALKILDLTYHSTKLSTNCQPSCQPSCQPLNGKKLSTNGDFKQIDSTYHSTRLSTDSTKVDNQVDNQVDNLEASKLKASYKQVEPQPKQITQLELLKTTIEMLQTQLEREHKEKLELLELLRATQNNLQAAQALHGGTIQKMLDKPTPTGPPVKEQTVNMDTQAGPSAPSEAATLKRPAPTAKPKHPRSTKKPAPRTTFWNRLLGKE